MLKNHTGPPQYYSVKLLQNITNSQLFLGFSHDFQSIHTRKSCLKSVFRDVFRKFTNITWVFFSVKQCLKYFRKTTFKLNIYMYLFWIVWKYASIICLETKTNFKILEAFLMNDCCRQQNTVSFTVNDSSVCVDTLLLLMSKITESFEG